MAPPAAQQKKIAAVPLVVGTLAAVAIIAGLLYFSRPVPKSNSGSPSAEAKAYLPSLRLSDVTMKATENFMKQQVIEVEGNIANNGSRSLQSVDVYCLFYGVDGREVYRERAPIVPPKASPLKPGENRRFRLPFDTVPETWNEALPRMVIAQITFAR